MRPPKYPLDPLARLRAEQVNAAARELGRATRAREDAAARRRGAELERDGHAAQADETRREERAALEDGALRAIDLARADAWEARVREEQRALEAQVERAAKDENARGEEEQRARGAVVAKRADAEVVAKDRERWDAARRRAADLRDEEAAEEAHRGGARR